MGASNNATGSHFDQPYSGVKSCAAKCPRTDVVIIVCGVATKENMKE